MHGRSRQLSTVAELLPFAERQIALLARCQPRNGPSEQARVLASLSAGRVERPRFSYDAVPDLGDLRHRLGAVATALENEGARAAAYAGRARELALETELVEAIGTSAMARLARHRFAPQDETSEARARRTAEAWARLEDERSETSVLSDDANDPRSLYRRLQSEVGRLRLPFRVETCALAAAAATGDGVILVARGRRLSLTATERIVVHEVLGHALPRCRAAAEDEPLFRVGSARGNDEQEGYALYLEHEHGHLDATRKRELGLRHLAATFVHEGADWVDTVEALRGRAASNEEAVAIASRAHRGGGLAREFVYLPALERVTLAAQQDRTMLDWLGRGRLDLGTIATLRSKEALRGNAARATLSTSVSSP